MGRSFDLGKKRISTKPKLRSKKSSSSLFSWIILIVVIIIASSVFSKISTPASNSTPVTSITMDKLSAPEENDKAITKNIVPSETPDNPTSNLTNASEKNNNENITTSTELNSTKETDTNLTKLETTIKILNGTNIKDNANNLKLSLEKSGYVIADTGDAKNNYSKTTIYFSSGKENIASQIINDTGISMVKSENENLTKNYDLLIVVGKDFNAN